MSAIGNQPSGHFTLLYFASASTFTHKSKDIMPAPSSPKKMYEVLEKMYPGIRRTVLDSCALAVNYEYVDLGADLDHQISEGDEVALIPPVSAG